MTVVANQIQEEEAGPAKVLATSARSGATQVAQATSVLRQPPDS